MAGLLKLYLIVTGIGTAVAVLMPGLVVVGLFLIVPGLILALMPTAFLWGGVFALIWFTLHDKMGDALAIVPALLGTAALILLAPLPSQSVSTRRLAAAIRPDILPTTPIALADHVRIDMTADEREPFDPTRPDAPRLLRCNGLCTAALFTDGVESVTLNPIGYRPSDEAHAIGDAPLDPKARTFRLVPRDRCSETLTPGAAGGLGDDLGEVRALEAIWNLRLSARDCIVAAPTRTTHDMVIASARYALGGDAAQRGYGWNLGPRGVEVERLEIRRGGAVLLRRLIATTEALARPLRIGAGGSLQTFRFGWERTTLSNASRFASLDGKALLRTHTNLAAHADPRATAGIVRERLTAMLADPAIDGKNAGWATAEIYFRALKPGTVTDADRALLPALIRDRRMGKFDGIWDAIRGLGADGALLRAPMVERLADPGADEQREAVRILGLAIQSLPPATFAAQTPAERALLADPAARFRARGLIARQADRGAAAAPLLLEIVDWHARAQAAASTARKRSTRSGDDMDAVIVDAARVALCRLGPDGAAALPGLVALDRAQLLKDTREWSITFARLGRPIEEIARPANSSITTERFHADLRRRLRTFDSARDCRSSFT